VKDPVIRFENVSKEYPFYQSMASGFKSFIFNLPKNLRTLKKKRFTALDKVSFEVEKGETLGIIGRNGSGKSTILSIIAGVIRQDSGYVYTRGRISSLLELGAGFHPDLSGIENIILNGILMGNTKREMLRKLEEIVDFSELGDFIYQPLRTYSSGMYIRLGFSVAIHIEPDILLVDEAIAVGDVRFQEKCLTKIKEFREKGITTIIVSHDMSSIIELCDRVIWIDNGKIKKTGAASDVVRDYLKSLDVTYELPEMGVEEIIQESRSTDDKNVPQKIKQSSWWDSPVVDMNEKIITGNGFRDLYDYLKTGLGFNGLSCLGALNRLTHCKDELIRTGICRSFKAIDVDDIYMEMPDSYDLFIAIDVFKKRQDILGIIEKIKELLRDDGIFIALDALRGHPYLPKEKEISTKILRYIGLDMVIEEINGPMNGKVRNNLDEIIGRLFEIIDVRYFGSSLYDLVIDRLLNSDRADKDALIELIVGLDQIMLKEGTLRGKYGLIVAKKRRGYQGKRGGDTELQEEPL